MNRYWAQRKSWLVALASGLIVLLVVGGGLLRENPTTLANSAATATALTREQADLLTMAVEAPDKATQNAILELTITRGPTPTWFDKMATEAILLTTSPTPWPTEPSAPWPFIQRPAGAGRLVLPEMGICGHSHTCRPRNFWVEKTKDKFIVVYAGHHFPGISAEALLYIEWWPLSDSDSMPKGGGRFPVPIPAQDVMIVDAVGEQLTLRTDDGTLLFFDVPSQQYISVPAPQISARAQHQANVGAIIENSDVPFTRPGFRAANRWAGKSGKGQITVFAGVDNVSSEDYFARRGMLAVVTSKGVPTVADAPQVYYPPEPVLGALWIFDVKGNLVALVDRGNHRFFFDLATRQFIDGLDAEKIKAFTAPLFDENMPIANATPQPVTPFIPPMPVSTPGPSAYP